MERVLACALAILLLLPSAAFSQEYGWKLSVESVIPWKPKPRPFPTLNLPVSHRQNSVPAMFLTNWNDSVIIWMNSTCCPGQVASYGPRIAEWRVSDNWGVNQIVSDEAFFRIDGARYTRMNFFSAKAYLEQNGTLVTWYWRCNHTEPPLRIYRNYVFPPHKRFYIAFYRIENPSESSHTIDVMEMLHVANYARNAINASYDEDLKGIIVDGRAGGVCCFALIPCADFADYQVANDSETRTWVQTCSPWFLFNELGYLLNNSEVEAVDVSVAFRYSLQVPPRGSITFASLRIIAPSMDDLKAWADIALSKSPDEWASYTASEYRSWLEKGEVPELPYELSLMYNRSLAVMKNAQNPVWGTIVASMNPTYGVMTAMGNTFKTWARDGFQCSLILDASGHFEEPRKWYEFASKAPLRDDFGYHTCYSFWTGDPVGFVEPEYDANGLAPIAIYYHYTRTGNLSELEHFYPFVKFMAEFLMREGPHGLGWADFSIWEEMSDPLDPSISWPPEYYSFTQACWVSGLWASVGCALAMGDLDSAIKWAQRAENATEAVERYLWTGSYYTRSLYFDGKTQNLRVDSEALALIYLGTVDPNSTRAASTLSVIEERLGSRWYGIGREEDDHYFVDAWYTPGGNEAGEITPPWPVCTMFFAWCEILRGELEDAARRAYWFVNHSAYEYMPAGEAVNKITGEPVISSCPNIYESAGTFVFTCLALTGRAYLPCMWKGSLSATAVDENGNPIEGEFEILDGNRTVAKFSPGGAVSLPHGVYALLFNGEKIGNITIAPLALVNYRVERFLVEKPSVIGALFAYPWLAPAVISAIAAVVVAAYFLRKRRASPI